MSAYYNEFEPYAAEWLRNLIKAGHIADGEVDERSIADVRPEDLRGFTQCHFFAGIGGWSYAARLAGYPDDRPLWSGSCPCQPYSVAGKGEGQKDERDLWPVWFNLIAAVGPPVVMGEQVAAAIGKHWLDRVRVDLEGEGYALGAAVLPACAVDAPHRRDRLWFVADASSGRRSGAREGEIELTGGTEIVGASFVAEPYVNRCQSRNETAAPVGHRSAAESEGGADLMADTQPEGWEGRVHGPGSLQETDERGAPVEFERRGQDGLVADTDSLGGQAEPDAGRRDEGSAAREVTGPGGADYGDVGNAHIAGSQGRQLYAERGSELSPWSASVGWIVGADGKARRVEPSIRLLAHGIQARVGKLRAFGNAIVPQVAAQVISAYLDIRNDGVNE